MNGLHDDDAMHFHDTAMLSTTPPSDGAESRARSAEVGPGLATRGAAKDVCSLEPRSARSRSSRPALAQLLVTENRSLAQLR